MKKFFAIFAVAAMLFACEEPVPETTLALDDAANATLNLSTAEATKVVAFTTNAAWTAADDAEWINVTPASGVAGTAIELTINVDENTTYDARAGKVTITAGDKNVEIAVNQSQTDEVNIGEVETLAFTIGYEGGEVNFPVNHNVEFTVTSDSDWAFVAEGTKALTTTEVVVEVAKNTTGADRVATITVEAEGGFVYDVTISQSGAIFKVDSTTIVPQVNTITPACGDADCGGVVSIALWDGKLVVCAGDGTMPKLVNKETGAVEGELVTGGFVPYYVTTDDAGNLVMCNRVRNGGKVWNWEVYFSVYYLTPGATEAVKAFNVNEPYDNPPRNMGANLGVRGNITDDATVWVPVEGYSYGSNAVNAWDIVDGVAGARQNFALSGFGGCWIGNYWIDAPNNFPAFAPLGTTVADGAVMMSCYSGNEINLVDGATKACTPIVPVVFDANGDANSNTLANAIEMLAVDGVSYAAVSGAGMYGGSYAYVYSVEGTAINRIAEYSFSPAIYKEVEGEDEPVAVLGGWTTDVCLEAVEGGLNFYCFDNTGANLAAYFIAL